MHDKRFDALIKHFGIQTPEEWSTVSPAEIRSVENVGPKTLDHLRLHLANLGITLANDRTCQYWQEHLSAIRGATAIAESQKSAVCPFRILIDKAEQQPWKFTGFRADSDQKHRPLIIPTEPRHLGPTHGDYTVEGLEGVAHVERKSLQDVISTVLGFSGGRRDQFEGTLAFLSSIPNGAIFVECDRDAAVDEIGDPKANTNRNTRILPAVRQKMFDRQLSAWIQDFSVPWIFSRTRKRAEVRAFQWFRRVWKHKQSELKRARKTDSANL